MSRENARTGNLPVTCKIRRLRSHRQPFSHGDPIHAKNYAREMWCYDGGQLQGAPEEPDPRCWFAGEGLSTAAIPQAANRLIIGDRLRREPKSVADHV